MRTRFIKDLDPEDPSNTCGGIGVNIYGLDERIDLDDIVEAAQVYARLITHLKP